MIGLGARVTEGRSARRQSCCRKVLRLNLLIGESRHDEVGGHLHVQCKPERVDMGVEGAPEM